MAFLKLTFLLSAIGLALCQDDKCLRMCTADYRPVCGTDGKTYGNRCGLESAKCTSKGKIRFAHNGECKKRCPKPCTRELRPVCGSNGKTYPNMCELENIICKDKSVRLAYPGPCKSTPGICPKPRIFSHCGYLCDKDSDCSRGEKCCSNGCGRDCMKACKQLRCAACRPGSKAELDFNGCPTCLCKDCSKVPEYCQEKCANGYMKDKQGCTLCKCKARCPANSCRTPCPNGYMKDTKGCPTCRCRPRSPCPPLGNCGPQCKIITSMLGCLICQCDKCEVKECPQGCGYLLDRNGCKQCRCPISECPIPACATPCLHGQKVDEKGCLTCECQKPPKCAPPRPCPRLCALKKQEDGCFKCKCPFMCPLSLCANKCENGFKPDENGCMTCECKEKVKCKPIRCMRPCMTGRMMDKNGCETCQCKPRVPCPRPMCMRGCKIVRGFNGCPKCKC